MAWDALECRVNVACFAVFNKSPLLSVVVASCFNKYSSALKLKLRSATDDRSSLMGQAID